MGGGPSQEEQVHEEEEIVQVDLGDITKVKQVVDEAVIRALLDREFDENHKWSNIKLLLMTLACIFACIAQFCPIPFPESRAILAVCCASYFGCSMLLQLLVSFYEVDIIMTTLPKDGTPSMVVRTDFPRYQENFIVKIESQGTGSEDGPKAEVEFSVAGYFDVDGHFDEVGVCEVMDRLIDSFQEQAQSGSKKTK